MDYKDYYKILGVAKDADAASIKSAYRKLARQYHPDVNPGDASAEARFKEVSEAYEVLSNPESRAQYDQLGANWKQYGQQTQAGRNGGHGFGGGFSGFAQGADGGSGNFGGGFSDFFRTFFGGGQPQEEEAVDLKAKLGISLKEAYMGGAKQIKLGGEQFRIQLKPGAKDGQTLRLRGKGRPSPTGLRGDLYLVLQIQPDAHFEREGDNLYTEQPLDVFTATLGGSMLVRMLDDTRVKVPIKAGTQGGYTMRLRGKGMPRAENPTEYGDLYLTVRIAIPQNLTPETQALWEQLQAKSQL